MNRCKSGWGLALLPLLLAAAGALAQDGVVERVAAPSATGVPAVLSRADVVGIRVGMPLQEALAIAKAHNPKLVWTAAAQGRFGLLPKQTFSIAISGAETGRVGGSAFTREHLTLEFMPGLGPDVVTGILRYLNFEGAPASRDQVVHTLEQKYGAVPDPRMSAEGLRLWLLDTKGQALRHREACHTDYQHRSESDSGNLGLLAGPSHFADTMKRIDMLEREAPRCGTLVYAQWVANRNNPALVDTVKVYLSDELFRSARLRALAEHLQGLNRATQRQQAGEAAQRPGPKF